MVAAATCARPKAAIGRQRFPVIALISAAAIALISAAAVAVFRLPAAWVWVGIPLAIAAYFLAPLLANWVHSASMW